MRATFASLALRNYRVWFVGILISNIGLWMARIAQSWIVLTALSDDSGLAVGITIGLQFGPQLVLAPLAGYIADRFPKRTVLLATQAGMSIAAAVQAALVLTGVVTLWHMYLLAALTGVIAAIDAPARNVFVSELVPRDSLTNAVSLNSVSFNSARLIGPAIAGLLIEWMGAGWALAANSLTYVATIVALVLIRTGELQPVRRPKAGTVHARDGFVYMRQHPQLMIATVMMFVVSATAMNTQVTIALMARVEFGRDAGDFGLLNSAMAIGSIAGGLFAASTSAPRLRTLVLSTLGLGLSLGVGALMQDYLLFALVLLSAGFFMIRLATGANAYIQLGAPARVRGQVMAIYLAVFLGGSPVGAPLIGWLGDAVSPPATLWAGVLGCLLGAGGAVVFALCAGRTSLAELAEQVPVARRIARSRGVHPILPTEHPETGPIPLPDVRGVSDTGGAR